MGKNKENFCTEKQLKGVTVIELHGEVDLSWVSEIRDVLLKKVGDQGMLAVDLSDVSYMDSSGIAVMVEAFQLSRDRGTEFMVYRPSEATRSVLTLTRMDRVFAIKDHLPGYAD